MFVPHSKVSESSCDTAMAAIFEENFYESDYDEEIEDEEIRLAMEELEVIRKRVEKQEQLLQREKLLLKEASPHVTKVAAEFVYLAELGKLVPKVASISDGPVRNVLDHQKHGYGMVSGCSVVHFQSDSDASSDSDCPVSPLPGNRLVWKKDSRGQKYCIERAAHDSSLEVVTTWVKHANGRFYKEQQTRERNRQ